MVVSVLLLPVPGITGTAPRASSSTTSSTRCFSAALSVAASPVVPSGTSPFTPPARTCRTSARSAGSSTAPPRNGVTSATHTPLNMDLPAILPLHFSLEGHHRRAVQGQILHLAALAAAEIDAQGGSAMRLDVHRSFAAALQDRHRGRGRHA